MAKEPRSSEEKRAQRVMDIGDVGKAMKTSSSTPKEVVAKRVEARKKAIAAGGTQGEKAKAATLASAKAKNPDLYK